MNKNFKFRLLIVVAILAIGIVSSIRFMNSSKIAAEGNNNFHHFQKRSLSIEEIYERSQYIIVGKFTSGVEKQSYNVALPPADEVIAHYEYYDFKITKLLKGETENKLVQIPFNISYEITEDEFIYSEPSNLSFNDKYILFVDRIEHNGKVLYVLQDDEQSIIRMKDDKLNLEKESHQIYNSFKNLKNFEDKIKELNKK